MGNNVVLVGRSWHKRVLISPPHFPATPDYFQSPPRRPRPSVPHASGTKTPPRPAGTPPPTAKRRLTSSTAVERGGSYSPGPAPLSPTSPSPAEKRISSTSGALGPMSPPNHLSERPAKFWLAPLRRGDDNAPDFTSLTPLVGTMESADESPSQYDGDDEQAEKKGGGLSGTSGGGDKGDVSAGRGADGGLDLPTHPSVVEKSADYSEDVTKKATHASEVKAATTAGGAATTEDGNRCAPADENHAAIDQLAGKNVLDWTAADVRAWVRALPRGLGEFAQAEAFANGRVDGKRLAKLTLSDIKRKEFRHAKFKPKVGRNEWNRLVNRVYKSFVCIWYLVIEVGHAWS